MRTLPAWRYALVAALVALAFHAVAAGQGPEQVVENTVGAAPPETAASNGALDALARALANPVNRLTWVSVGADYRGYGGDLPGASDQTGAAWRVSGGMARTLPNGRHWQFRLDIPVNVDLPAWIVDFGDPIWELNRDYADFLLRQSPQVTASTGGFRSAHGHVADVGFDVGYGRAGADGRSWLVGFAAVFPSSQDQSVSRDQALLGPDLAVGFERGRGVYGARLRHLVDVSGDERFDTNETTLEATVALDLGRGWQALARPAVLRDWEADAGNEWLVPLAAGAAKTFRVGRWPFRAVGEATWYARTADRFGVEWQVAFSLTAVWPGG